MRAPPPDGLSARAIACAYPPHRPRAFSARVSALTRLSAPSPPPAPLERSFGKLQEDDLEETLAELSTCTSIKCIIRVHDKLDGRTRFNLPHFFLVGWQKCATTSVNAFLRHHYQYLPGLLKEPHYFSVCQSNVNAPHCEAKNETQYLRDFLRIREAAESKLELATMDASADYAQKGGPLARRLYRLFPWLKVVIMIREPISRVISYTRMHTQGEQGGGECVFWAAASAQGAGID